jgi:hypothetical protein
MTKTLRCSHVGYCYRMIKGSVRHHLRRGRGRIRKDFWFEDTSPSLLRPCIDRVSSRGMESYARREGFASHTVGDVIDGAADIVRRRCDCMW